MASNARQNKSARKGAPDNSRRAWSGARASPTFSPSSHAARSNNPASSASNPSFPPLAQAANGTRPDNAQSSVLQSLAGLTGTTVTISTKASLRYEGVVGSVNREGDNAGVTLKDAKELSTPGAPLKDQQFIALSNIDSWQSGPADAKVANGDSFRTDTDISSRKTGLGGRERELQAWQPTDPAPGPPIGGQGDEVTFGPGANTSWDQFAVNEQLFGVTTNFDEDLYTTKLDRTAADFKEKERRAQKIANEINGTASNNPHIAEERGLAVDDSGINEEDKYGAVVRGTNAYIPPGARKAGYPSVPANNIPTKTEKVETKAEAPKQEPTKTATLPAEISKDTVFPSQAKEASPPTPATASGSVSKPPADPLPAFRDFVTNEKQRLMAKKQNLVKSEMDRRMAELVKFSQSFKLNKPIPEDLVPILAKDEEKQRLIKEKSSKDASDTQARAIGPVHNLSMARGLASPSSKAAETQRKIMVAPPLTKAPLANQIAPPASTVQKPVPPTKPSTSTDIVGKSTASRPISMFIQAIPPFKGRKATTTTMTSVTNGTPAPNGINTSTSNNSATSNNNLNNLNNLNNINRLNVNASTFRPNPKGAPSSNASASNQSVASNTVSPKPKPEVPQQPNPFFGTKSIKKNTPTNIKEDFNPFKHNKIVEASQVVPSWPYNGKRYMSIFPAPVHPPQQHSPMVPPAPPAMPPPPYEEDPSQTAARTAAAAAAGYYAYPPYAYPPQMYQHMMPPPGPPGAYVPAPFMQHMPYPPGMHPPNAMYVPPMGQMPPPQPGAYMPPPGGYPPPPHAGQQARPGMPPTPIPAHAHPYYHQSPQLQHAVPYPIMMPPPPPGPPHGYEQGPAPPVQMGGHA